MIMPILVFGAYRYDVTGASAIALLLSVSALYGAFDATVKNLIISIAYRATPSISLFLFISVTISLILSEANTERKQAKKSWKVLLITMH
jgi:integral membrane sensor domain MASE1